LHGCWRDSEHEREATRPHPPTTRQRLIMSIFVRRAVAAAAATALAGIAAALPAGVSAGATPSHAQINGSGSSWAANAVNQWIADVNKQGLQVVFTSTGSAQGRKDFAYKTTDFGVSDIAYQGTDPLTGDVDSSLGRPYAYLPIVAGGTAFPYNLSVAGRRIRNLRLGGDTLASIFTNKITYWDDPKIKADNNNALALPHIPIIPVVHSEGSGSTAQFTRYMSAQYPSIWGPFNHGNTSGTEYFPRAGSQVAQNGSDGVINFITSGAGNGTIGFDEYSYALGANFPVAKVRNASGYFTAPTQYNDAVALTKAIINQNPSSPDYLTQDLHQVYVNPDIRTYPLSSYSYMIIPTGANSVETKTSSTAQRQTIADFLYYSICQGQAEMGPIGYSPLPLYLVQDGFGQIAKLKAADPNVDLTNRDVTTCNNPTFDAASHDLTNNRLAKIAPNPPACDKQGAGPCDASVGVANGNPSANGSVGGTGGAGGTSGGTGGGTGSKAPGSGSGSASAGVGTHVDPNTGQLVSNGASGGGTSQDVVGVPTQLAASASQHGFSTLLYVLTIVALLVIMAGPVLLSRYWANRAEARK
jgi:phosphate ABC transporter phosphate-binding protein